MKIFFVLIISLLLLIVRIDSASAQSAVHKVKSGETLSALAKKYQTSVAEFIRLNPSSEKGLRIGDELKIPSSASAKKPAPVPGKKEQVKTEKKEDVQVKPKVESTAAVSHTVVSGESLSKIARKYNVSLADLQAWNNGIKPENLKIGQVLKVASAATANKEEKVKEEKIADNQKEEQENSGAEPGKHIVFKGETLSSIAQKEGTSIEEIRKLNQLKSDQLSLGQILLIPANALKSNSSDAGSPVTTQKKEQAVEIKPVNQQVQTSDIQEKADAKAQAGIREVNNTLGYTRIVETGFAESIEGDLNSKKHLCLHKSAPIGSIVQVKNEVNGQSVFVKVIGKLPDTGSNERIIIRISRIAYDRLMASGKRFPVEVSYPESQP